MKKKILTRLLLIISTFIICIIGSFILRNKRTVNDIEDILDQDILIVDFQRFYDSDISTRGILKPYNFDINTLNDLEEASDLIVEVSMLHHSQPASTFISEVKIENIFKGDTSETSLYVFEPVSLDNKEGIGFANEYEGVSFYQLNIPESWYVPMKKNERYILFLNKIDEYHDEQMYNLTSIPYGKIPIRNEITQYTVDINEQFLSLDYQDYKDCDVIVPKNAIYNSKILDNTGTINTVQDYNYVKENYFNIIDKSYQKYLKREVIYNEKIINNQYNRSEDLFKQK